MMILEMFYIPGLQLESFWQFLHLSIEKNASLGVSTDPSQHQNSAALWQNMVSPN